MVCQRRMGWLWAMVASGWIIEAFLVGAWGGICQTAIAVHFTPGTIVLSTSGTEFAVLNFGVGIFDEGSNEGNFFGRKADFSDGETAFIVGFEPRNCCFVNIFRVNTGV